MFQSNYKCISTFYIEHGIWSATIKDNTIFIVSKNFDIYTHELNLEFIEQCPAKLLIKQKFDKLVMENLNRTNLLQIVNDMLYSLNENMNQINIYEFLY